MVLIFENSLEIEQDITKNDFFLFRRKSPYFMEQEKLRKKILANLIVLGRLNSTFVPTSLDNSNREIL